MREWTMKLNIRVDYETWDDLEYLSHVERSTHSETVRRLIMQAARESRSGQGKDRLAMARADRLERMIKQGKAKPGETVPRPTPMDPMPKMTAAERRQANEDAAKLERMRKAPPTSNPADEWHGADFAMVRCNPCKSWRCMFEEGCPNCGDVIRTSTGHMVSRAWFERYLAQESSGKPLIA